MEKKLKVVFLVGCLEPGADGVGDYTYTLAAHLCSQGHTCLIIALKDPFIIQQSVHKSDQLYPLLSCIRFRNIISQQPCFKTAIHAFQPDYISLQFVPYAFHKKGLPFFLSSLLQSLAQTYPFHIMMHELWIGFEPSAPLKHKCLGYIQKWCIQNILTTLQPIGIHTHSSLYKHYLSQLYSNVALLPLFSPIQKNCTAPVHQSLYALLQNKCHLLPLRDKDSLWIFSLFGTLHPEWPSEPLLPLLLELARKHHKGILILHFGHIGRGERLWQALLKRYQPECNFLKLGPLTTAEIARVLQNTHFGIATSPLHLLEKSSSALTFLEWGCPLIVNRIEKDVKLPTFFEERILKINTNNFTQQLLHTRRYAYASRLGNTSQTFLADLKSFIA